MELYVLDDGLVSLDNRRVEQKIYGKKQHNYELLTFTSGPIANKAHITNTLADFTRRMRTTSTTFFY